MGAWVHGCWEDLRVGGLSCMCGAWRLASSSSRGRLTAKYETISVEADLED